MKWNSKKNIKLNCKVTSIEKENDLWFITDNNNIYQTINIITTVDIKALKILKLKVLILIILKKWLELIIF